MKSIIALANDEAAPEVADFVALENELKLDGDGWALLAPFGEHRKERVVMHDGQIKTERFVQILDEAGVDAVLANEKGTNLFTKIKRALIKRPIYRDHPDLKLYSPQSVAIGNQDLHAIGVNDGCRKTERGLEFRPLLAPAGVEAVENHGCKYPSALFLLRKTGVVRDGGWVEVRPFALASIGLTPTPNISGVDSLANASANKPAASKPNQNEDHMKQLLIGWLAAQGIALANDSTDQAVFEAFTKEMQTRTTSLTALGNDKTSLTQTVNTLTSERDAQKQRADDAVTALSNAQTEVAAARQQFIEARVDLAITQGKVPVADRAPEITALANSKQLADDLKALDARPAKFATLQADRKHTANATDAAIALSNAMEVHIKAGKSKSQAMDLVIKEQPALVEAYRKEGGALTV